jgi:hypothetical protein
MNRALYFRLNLAKLFYEYFDILHALTPNTYVNKLLSSVQGEKFNK